MTDETTPTSSPSLAGCYGEMTPVQQEWAAMAAEDKAIDDRALEVAWALLDGGWINEVESRDTREELLVKIAAVLRPFFAKPIS